MLADFPDGRLTGSSVVDFQGAKILITGGSGFIGTNACEYFQARGAHVMNLDTRPPKQPKHMSLWAEVDIMDRAHLGRVVKEFDPDYVVHLAARTDLLEKRNLSAYSMNFEGTGNLLEACALCTSLRRVLVASSRMVCRIGYVPRNETDYCPPNLYGESKVRAEQLVRDSKARFSWTLLRITSIWGPWFDVPYRLFFKSIANRTYVHPRGANPEKSFGYVGNTVYQFAKLLAHGGPEIDQGTFYLCDYPPLRLREWADLIRAELGVRLLPPVPLSVLRTAALIGDALARIGWDKVPLTSFRLDNLLTPMVYNTDTLTSVCGPLPFTLAEGIRETVEWMRARPR